MEIDRIYKIYRMRRKKINPVNLVNPVYFRRSFHVALRRPETMKRESVRRFIMCGKMGQDERWSEVVKYLSFNSIRSLSRVAQTCPKLFLRQAPEER
jgi:preprotein translocase subunit Sec63